MGLYEELKTKLNNYEYELGTLTVTKHGTVPWNPGVQDQYKSDSYSYVEYINPSRASFLKSEIERIKGQIANIGPNERAQAHAIETARNKYEYEEDGKKYKTSNPALAAAYNAQKRLYGMGKIKRTIAKVTGKERKFKNLWNKTLSTDKAVQNEVAAELNGMFRK